MVDKTLPTWVVLTVYHSIRPVTDAGTEHWHWRLPRGGSLSASAYAQSSSAASASTGNIDCSEWTFAARSR
jgi:hypothetical protein